MTWDENESFFDEKGVVKIGGLILKIKKFNMGYVSQILYLFLYL